MNTYLSSRWAVLVVDMQNDFLDKSGYYGDVPQAVLAAADGSARRRAAGHCYRFGFARLK